MPLIFKRITIPYSIPIHDEEMKKLNDEMKVKFQGKGLRPLPDWWIDIDSPDRTELSWWELDDSNQMNKILERLSMQISGGEDKMEVLTEKLENDDIPSLSIEMGVYDVEYIAPVAPVKFVTLYFPDISQEVYDEMSNEGTPLCHLYAGCWNKK